MREPRAFLALLIAAVLLGAGAAEAARYLPGDDIPATPSFSIVKLLLSAPDTGTAGSHQHLFTEPESFLPLAASLPVSPCERVLASALEDAFSRKTAPGGFDQPREHILLETKAVNQDLHRCPLLSSFQDLVPGGQTSLFQGLWTDPVTGLSYARNRWYDARTASWLSEDPAGTFDSTNMYAFVGWQPHMYADPTGEAALLIPALLGALSGIQGATMSIDAATTRDPHANMLHAGLKGGAIHGTIALGSYGVGGAVFSRVAGPTLSQAMSSGLSASRLGISAGRMSLAGSAAGALGELAYLGGTDIVEAGMLGDRSWRSPGEYSFGIGLGAGLGALPGLVSGRGGTKEITIFAFKATKNRAAREAFPQARLGHVGFSFNGKKVFGFGPRVRGMDLDEVVAHLKAGGSFPGRVSIDTATFVGLRKLGVQIHTYNYRVSRFQYWRARIKTITDRMLGRLLRKRYSTPPFKDRCYNCATYPTSIGLETPFPSGKLGNYLQ